MGFFNKKKSSDASASVLSETEIQKKLYGEFSGGTRVVAGERSHDRDIASFSQFTQEAAVEKKAVPDLFHAPHEALDAVDPLSRRSSPEIKAPEGAARYVPLHDFEKKAVFPEPARSGINPSVSQGRFSGRSFVKGRMSASIDLLGGLLGSGKEFFETLLSPEKAALRRVLYWISAVLAVALLFWGVNALNSQREEAMQMRYRLSREAVPEKMPETVVASAPSGVTEERPVIITPAPVRPVKARPPQVTTPGTPAGGLYVIQVATYAVREDAERIENGFSRAGFRAFVKENTRASGRIFYVVFMGGFGSLAEAQAQLAKFRAHEVARPFPDAFVKAQRS